VDGVEVAVEVWTRACGCQRDHEKWNRTMRLKYLSKENGEKAPFHQPQPNKRPNKNLARTSDAALVRRNSRKELASFKIT